MSGEEQEKQKRFEGFLFFSIGMQIVTSKAHKIVGRIEREKKEKTKSIA